MKFDKRKQLAILGVFLLLLNAITPIIQAKTLGEQTKEVLYGNPGDFLPKTIAILYDPYHPTTTEIARAIHETIAVLYSNVKLVAMYNPHIFADTFKEDNWIQIYVFDSDLNGIKFAGWTMPWRNVSRWFNFYSDIHHIGVFGNSYLLAPMVDTNNVCLEQTEVLDARIAYLHAIWSVAEIFSSEPEPIYQDIGEKYKIIAVKYFGDEFENLLSAEFDPQYGLGETDPQEAEERLQDSMSRYPNTLYKIHPVTGEYIDPTEQVPDFKPVLDIVPKEDGNEGDVILGNFPSLASISGAAGDVINTILSVVGAKIPDGVITMAGDYASEIKTILEAIPEVLGLIRDPSASSALELFFGVLKDMFPSLEQYKPYVELASKAFFALREGPEEIIALIDDLIHFLVPESAQSFIDNITSIILPTTAELSKLAAFNNWGDFLMSVLNKKLLKLVVDKALEFVDVSNITQTSEALGTMLRMCAEVIATKNMTYVMTDSLPYLAITIFKQFSSDEGIRTIEILGTMLELAFGTAGVIDYNYKEALEEILQALFPDIPDKLDQIKETIDEFIQQVKEVVEDPTILYDDVKNSLIGLLTEADDYSSMFDLTNEQKEVVAEGLALGMKILQGDFSVPSTVNLVSLIQEILDAFFPVISIDAKTIITEALDLVTSFTAFITDSDALKSYVKGTVEAFMEQYANPSKLIETILENIIPKFGGSLNITLFQEIGDVITLTVDLLKDGFDFSIQNILQTIVSLVGITLPSVTHNIPFEIIQKIFKLIWSDDPVYDNVQAVVSEIIQDIEGLISTELKDAIELILTFIGSAKGVFKEGVKWLINQVVGWISGKIADLLNSLTDQLNNFFSSIGEFAHFAANFSIAFGSFSAFMMSVEFSLVPGFSINKDAIQQLINDVVFHASKLFDLDNLGAFFAQIFKAINIIPMFKASLSVNSGTSGKNDVVKHLLDALGLSLSFTGSAGLTLQLFKITNGKISITDFFKLIDFFFKFQLTISKRFSIAEFFFGPAVSALAKVAEYIGLGGIYLDILFSLAIEIVKRIETPTQQAADILKIVIGISVAIVIDISLVIVGITITLGFTVTLSFIQDFAASSPLQVILEILLTLKVKLTFLFWDWSKTISWGPDPIYLAGGKDNPETRDEMSGLDQDEDGLPDLYELSVPGLNGNLSDSDGDGLEDKFEISTSKTDPILADTDGDGLEDGFEFLAVMTNPLQKDSDYDGLDDYEEVVIYGTDPNSQDTDGDALDDYYEVNTSWNISDITPSVREVQIGGEVYNDHTDPLNPDTDGDGLLDGEEGPFGGYYGPEFYPESAPDQPPIIRNQGYTHPLDNDTDDDSYRLLYNGTIAPDHYFYMPMTDKIEIEGQWVIFIEDDELMPRLVRTNPCNPDTDGDTGIGDPSNRGESAPPNEFLNSDGKELWLEPPTDPNDADMDDDGLIDGLEGWGKPESNHTDPRNPDTDGDGLGDLQDILLGSDPLRPDSDGDGVLDGAEFFTFGTNPAIKDTDYDGLLDGEEIYLFHTNPLAIDSDGDGIEDGMEVLVYDTDPMDEDIDNDGLTDFEEIFYYGTSARVYDSDGDGLSDYEEVIVYFTDPLNWDSDNDTLWYPNEQGNYTFPLSDGDEVKIYGTNPLSSDTDSDGIYDSLELYIGSGLIPDFEPVPLNPLLNDTDSDGIIDSHEFNIANISNIIYPYRSFIITAPFNTSAVDPDTDDDGLLDGEEIYGIDIAGEIKRFGTMPNTTDTDGDGLTDYEEIFAYQTDPVTDDTDGDKLSDYVEINVDIYYPGTTLDPLDPDVDDDLLPDGAELTLYETDPNEDDEDGNGQIDGLDWDLDQDGLEDGLEFFEYHTYFLPGGGVTQPDSDRDGLADGAEVYLYGTNCSYWDTDNDTYSDGLEVMIGTNPLQATTEEEFQAALDAFSHGIIVLSPIEDIEYAPTNYTFILYNTTPVLEVNYTIYQGSTILVTNQSMDFDSEKSLWISTGDVLSAGKYVVNFYVKYGDNNITTATVHFLVGTAGKATQWAFIGIGIGAGITGLTTVIVLIIRRFRIPVGGGGT